MFKNTIYKNISQYKHNSIFIKFLLTFLVLFIIPLISVTIIYFNTFIGEQHKKILDSDQILLNHLVALTDEKVKSVEQSIINLILLDKTTTAINLNDPQGQPKAVLNQMRGSLNNLKISSDIVDDIFVYYRNADIVVSTNAVYDFDLFFNSLQKYKTNNLESWKTFFKDNMYKSEDVLPSLYVHDIFNHNLVVSKSAMTFISGISYYEKNPAVVYGIEVNSPIINDMIRKLNITKQGFIYIVNREDDIVTSTDTGNAYSKFINKKFIASLSKNPSDNVLKADNAEFYVLYAESGSSRLKYVALIPEDEIMTGSNFIMKILVLLCIVLTLFTLLSAIFISGRIYKPINKLVELVDTVAGKYDCKNRNEFEYLNANINNILKDTRNMDITLKKSLSFSREKLLMNLIKGQYGFLESNPGILQEMDIKFSCPDFCVYTIKIDNFKEFKQKYNEFDRDLLRHMLSDITLGTGNYGVYSFATSDSEFCMIMNFESRKQPENYTSMKVADICRSVADSLPFTVTTGIGTVKNDIYKIAKSYEEACFALNCRKVNSTGTYIEYEKAAFIRNEYYYPIDKERSIISYLKAGDYNNAIKVIEHIINENFSMDITFQQLHYIFSELLSTILKVIYDHEGKIQDIFNVENFGEQLFELETAEDTISWFRSICSRLCNYVLEQQESGNKELIQKISQYVQDNYNRDITLETVADHFNISYSYLSRYYKQQLGVNFLDSLYELRMKKASEMLQDPSIKINLVAETVGYNNVNHFIKMFKKYAGVTPGKFRQTS